MYEKELTCPYCLEAITILLDMGSDYDSEIIEDCEVCCRPIEIKYSFDEDELIYFNYKKIEGNEF
ncbi:CPXCG motif-containing cysteine-rich protein [Halarcobacter sp.]|uniref:CPXCG motif-containing cysteine-rich protein n=1 Tax=Halarcobacter sp. TaxID=2321133 RepID=UPI002AAAD7E3|nr:CPXCG motif-containing cysteine-rich protein [Halarcobacter sp.]